MYLLDRLLRAVIKDGRLDIIDADDRQHTYGSSSALHPDVTIVLKDRRLHHRLALRPQLCFGEAYMDGDVEISRGTLSDALNLLLDNFARARNRRRSVLSALIIWTMQRLTQVNGRLRSFHNVAHHYDLSSQLYQCFLDSDLQYSCGYFPSSDVGLDGAQAAKKKHLAAKLLLKRNQRVLDIGCGWGGLALELARDNAISVDGITLSNEQLEVARRRAHEERLSDRVHFSLKDYRDMAGEYDRIVSVGMFEHVGTPNYRKFFSKVYDLLSDDGIAVIHSIGSLDGPAFGNPWIRKYIFPGGYAPALSEVLPAIESSGLTLTDVEILRLHYAETLSHWRERFLMNWQTIEHLYDARFRRMWEFYLAGCEAAFRHDGLMVFQLQLAKKLQTVPLTRDYIHQAERPRTARASRSDQAA
jgi:cyclopropane-fatty-acyl-phospholipid synthase